MNTKIEKLRAERSKNDSKIDALHQRNKEIDEAITQIENGEIVGLARNTGMSMEELAEYLKAFRKSKAPFSVNAESEATDYEEN